MMSGIALANFTIVVNGLVFSLLGLLLTVFLRRTNFESRGFFLVLFSLLVGCTASEFVCALSRSTLLSRVTLFLSSLFSSLLIPPFSLHLLRCTGKSWRSSWLFCTVAALWAAYFVLLVLTQFTNVIYYYTPDNVYHRGPWYLLLLVPPTLMMAVNLIGLYCSRSALTPRQRLAFLSYFLVPMVCMVLQMFFYGLLLIALGMSVGIMIMFTFLLSDQVDRSLRQAEENARQQASIYVLQMRPHFIYNTLMSIYYLCKKDADKAQQVILDFSRYLKKNFTAIASEDSVPFTEELEHTRAYLAVEEARYEDRLFVQFDTPVTMFRLPPLTLQPIVENAVVHGMRATKAPIRISVVTRNTGTASEIVVEDDGPGFRPADSDEPHIALQNIRRRLAMMCGGTLTIASRKEGGTAVTVSIPLPKPEE